ncbi:MAG: ankyrin repeat domain-containing protein [Polyangiaceae bacterium]|nr:ankyrin repeat domain-containing protein [Polyangiaceae bacterium]MCE7894400.1 ankyrin repeat domain-containing protein [Sorangiineae bacterium PRO1]MCL4752632.1 ankyrin repeat domain-containing protein [Myxococcales bacterium]
MTTRLELDLERPAPGEDWELPHWMLAILPERRADAGHYSGQDSLPATLLLRVAGEPVAIAEPFTYQLTNEYCYDSEYYLVLRASEIVDAAAWSELPFGHLAEGDVFAAWDRFHGHEYLRTPESEERSMSYGGDWADLQLLVDDQHPRAVGPRPTRRVSPASLLRAVRAGDVERVRALLTRGADPNAGRDAPDAALRGVSVDRNSTALFEAVLQDSPPLVEALLAAGASVAAPWPDAMPPLACALVNRKLAVIPVLLAFGADPDEGFRGETARRLADELGLSELLNAARA